MMQIPWENSSWPVWLTRTQAKRNIHFCTAQHLLPHPLTRKSPNLVPHKQCSTPQFFITYNTSQLREALPKFFSPSCHIPGTHNGSLCAHQQWTGQWWASGGSGYLTKAAVPQGGVGAGLRWIRGVWGGHCGKVTDFCWVNAQLKM